MPARRRTEQPSGLAVAAVAVTEHSKLSRQIVEQLVPLLGKENVPPEIKVHVGLMIFLIVALSAGLVILVANVVARLGGIPDIHFEYYLLYVSFVLLALLAVLIFTSGPARRFENTANFELNMERVARARASRQRAIVLDGRI
jgi:TRAP-type C4-dicarboxylate transport system permease small subunit